MWSSLKKQTNKISSADLTGAVDFTASTHFPFKRPQRPSIYAALSFRELDIADNRLSALLISYSLDMKLIAVFTKLTRFSRAVNFVLTRTSVPLDPLAFVEDTFEIQFGFPSIPEPELYETDELCLHEALRIRALIFIKETLQEYPLVSHGSTNMLRGMKNAPSFIFNIKKYVPLLLWLLFTGGISSGKKSLDGVHGPFGESCAQTLDMGGCKRSSEESTLS
jgi:hypothetical protein